jgi:hypothetical protein
MKINKIYKGYQPMKRISEIKKAKETIKEWKVDIKKSENDLKEKKENLEEWERTLSNLESEGIKKTEIISEDVQNYIFDRICKKWISIPELQGNESLIPYIKNDVKDKLKDFIKKNVWHYFICFERGHYFCLDDYDINILWDEISDVISREFNDELGYPLTCIQVRNVDPYKDDITVDIPNLPPGTKVTINNIEFTPK